MLRCRAARRPARSLIIQSGGPRAKDTAGAAPVLPAGGGDGVAAALVVRFEMKTRPLVALPALALALALAAGIRCAVDARRPKGSDTEQIEQLLLAGEAAAERRDAAALGRLVSRHYRDSSGFTAASLRYRIAEYLRRQQSIEIEIPLRSVRIRVDPGTKTAVAEFDLTLRTQAEGVSLRADLHPVLTLAREPVYYFGIFPGEEWRVTSAEGYQSAPFD